MSDLEDEVDDDAAWTGRRDTSGAPCNVYLHYTCDGCATEWEDWWSCACNDKCPGCGREIQPDTAEFDG